MAKKTKAPKSSADQAPVDDDAVMFNDRSKGSFFVQRNGMEDAKWNEFVKTSKSNPEYRGTFAKGKEVGEGYLESARPDASGARRLAQPNDDAVVFSRPKTGELSTVHRDGMPDEDWEAYVKRAQSQPGYSSTYTKGEESLTSGDNNKVVEPAAVPEKMDAKAGFTPPADDEALVFHDPKSGDVSMIRRGEMSDRDWHSEFVKALRNPNYNSYYRNGEEVHSNPSTNVNAAERSPSNDQARGVRGFVDRSIAGAALRELPSGGAGGGSAGTGGSGGSGAEGAPAAYGETQPNTSAQPASEAGSPSPLLAAPALLNAAIDPNTGVVPSMQAFGSAISGAAKNGLNAAGEGLTNAGMPNLGNAASGLASGIKPQPPLTGLPPMLRQGAQASLDQQNGVVPDASQPAGAPAPMAPAPGEAPGGAADYSLKMKTSGAPVAMPGAAPANQDELNRSLDKAQFANEAGFDAQMEKDKGTDSLRRAQIARMERFEADRVEKENHVNDSVNEARMAHDSVIAQMNKPIAKIDPARFWSNQNAGSKALMLVAGAFSGLAGKGNEWLTQLDAMADQDVKAQQMDIENASQRLGMKEGATRSAYAMARESGLDQRASIATAKDALLRTMQLQLEAQVAAVPDEVKRAQLAQMNMQIEQLREKSKSDFRNALSEESLRRAQAYGIYQHARNEEMELGLKALKPIKKEPIPVGEQSKISNSRTGLEILPELKKAVGDGSLSHAFMDELMKRIPGTDASKRNQRAQFLGRATFANIDQSVMNAHDQEFMDKLKSGIGVGSVSQGDIEAFLIELKSKYNSTLKTAQELNQETGSLKPIESGVPGEKPR